MSGGCPLCMLDSLGGSFALPRLLMMVVDLGSDVVVSDGEMLLVGLRLPTCLTVVSFSPWYGVTLTSKSNSFAAALVLTVTFFLGMLAVGCASPRWLIPVVFTDSGCPRAGLISFWSLRCIF